MAEPDTAIEPIDEAAEAQSARESASERLKRGQVSPTRQAYAGAVEVASDEDYDKLPGGSKYVGPDKKSYVKPYAVTSDEEFDAVPEGAEYIGPDDQHYKKPVYRPLDSFSAQTLYDMARTDQAKEQALKQFYGENVKRDQGGFYVEDPDGGVPRRPGARDLKTGAGVAAAEVFPAIGMTGGGLLGGVGGTAAAPGPGTAAGGFGGAVLGAMAGRQVNNIILGLAGIHEDIDKQVASMGMEGLGVAGGEAVGRGLSKVPAALGGLRRGAQAVGDKVGGLKENLSGVLEQMGITPERARGFLGTTPEAAEQAARITERGGKVPPSVLYPEAPALKKVEEFDSVFRAQNVFGQANEAYYNREVENILQDKAIGTSLDELATRATKKVSSEKAGQMVVEAARKDMAQADGELENAVLNLKKQAALPIEQAGGEKAVVQFREEAMERLKAAQARAAETAENVVQTGMRDLAKDIEEAGQLAKDNQDPSLLHRKIAAEFQGYNVGIRQRARLLYNSADAAAGDTRIDTASLAEDADAFLKIMPETVRQKYPAEIADLKKLLPREAGESDAAEPVEQLTFGQLRHLRSWFRHGIDYNDLTPDMRQGSLKFFEKKINAVLHDAEAPAEQKAAVAMLDQADTFYKQNIPFLSDKMVQGTVDLLKSGAGVNPEAIAKQFFDPERTTAMRRVRGIVGENLWKAVQVARVTQMLENSRIVGSEMIDGAKFADLVEHEARSGLLATAYDDVLARRLEKTATDIGRLKGSLPITQEPGDTISMLMRRAEIAKAEIEKFADLDPIKALAKETKRLDDQFRKAMLQSRKDRKAEPLHFLYEDSMSALATRAADKILGSQDLITAAATQFGRDSSEFKSLQQVYAARFFQRPFGRTAKMREELGSEKGMTEEVQALMFPGVTRKMMNQLADDMEFLFSGGGSDVGGSMAAASRVLHPEQNIPLPGLGTLGTFLTKFPGVSTLSRVTLGKYFALIMDATSHPNFINWLAGRLSQGPAARQEAKDVLQQRLRLGGWFGAAAGQVEADQMETTAQ